MATKKRTEHEFYCGKRLKRFRRKRNWTLDDLEFEVGGIVTARTLGSWEKQGIPASVNITKLAAVAKALELPRGLEDLERVETAYLQELTRDILQDRLELAADDVKAAEIVRIFEFIDKCKDAEGGDDESDAAPYDPLKDLVKKKKSTDAK